MAGPCSSQSPGSERQRIASPAPLTSAWSARGYGSRWSWACRAEADGPGQTQQTGLLSTAVSGQKGPPNMSPDHSVHRPPDTAPILRQCSQATNTSTAQCSEDNEHATSRHTVGHFVICWTFCCLLDILLQIPPVESNEALVYFH